MVSKTNSAGTFSSLKDLTKDAPWLKYYKPRQSLSPDCAICLGAGDLGYHPNADGANWEGHVFCDCAEGAHWRTDAETRRQALLAERARDLQEKVQRRFAEFSRLHCKGEKIPSLKLMRPAPGVDKVRDFERDWDFKQSLLLTGPYGTGKTQAAVGLAADLMPRLMARFQAVQLVTAPDFIGELQHGFDDDHAPREGYSDVLESYRTCGLLVFDDLGAGKLTPFVKEQFYKLFDYRYRQELPTFATSNFMKSAFVEAVGDMRVVERIKETFTVIEFTGENQRRHEMAARASQLKVVK